MQTLKSIVFVLIAAAIFFTSCNKDQGEFETSINQNISTIAEIETEDGTLTRRCNTTEHMEQLLKDPSYKRKHQDKFTRLKNALTSSRSSADCTQRTVLPLAIHFQGVSNPDPACLMRLARQQVDILNKDFQGKNADRSNWKQVAFAFSGTNLGEACLEFQIANRNHPKGFNLAEGAPAITINQTKGDMDPRWAGYLNIYVQFGTGVLGYAPLGGTGQGDGVVIEGTAFGEGKGCGDISPTAPYNLGRTLTHEMGHYLLLDHIWGGGCGSDDGVTDTPSQARPNRQCPAIGTASCSTNDLFMNYMDYVYDACMYMFSDGQAARMSNYVQTSLQHLKDNAARVIVQTPTFDKNAYYRLTTQWQGEGKSLDVINDGKNNQLQLAKTGNYSGQYWKLTPVGSGYFRLTNMWQGTGKSLDIINDGKNNRLQLAKTGNYSGQYWKVTPVGGGYFRLTTQWQGEGKSLDVINDGKNNRLQLANSGNYSGQFWKLTKN